MWLGRADKALVVLYLEIRNKHWWVIKQNCIWRGQTGLTLTPNVNPTPLYKHIYIYIYMDLSIYWRKVATVKKTTILRAIVFGGDPSFRLWIHTNPIQSSSSSRSPSASPSSSWKQEQCGISTVIGTLPKASSAVPTIMIFQCVQNFTNHSHFHFLSPPSPFLFFSLIFHMATYLFLLFFWLFFFWGEGWSVHTKQEFDGSWSSPEFAHKQDQKNSK